MSKRRRDLSDDEQQLWRRVVERVKPRKRVAKSAIVARKPDTETPRTTIAKAAEARTRPSSLPTRAPAMPPANRGNEKRVRRGKIEIGGTLDLHGHTQETARATVGRFLRAAYKRGDRTVVVVTGVGRTGQGVLRQRLPEWLADGDWRAIVSGFAQAHRAHGGAGAYYVFLKKNAEQPRF